MKKSSIALVAIFGILAGTALVAQSANAFGLRSQGVGSEQHLEDIADVVGADAHAVKTKLETTTLPELLQEFGVTEQEFDAAMEERMKERLTERGFTDEEIQSRIDERNARRTARKEAVASLMGIDVETLSQELQTTTLPELLDSHGISHVDLHDALQSMHEKNSEMGFGHSGRHKGM